MRSILFPLMLFISLGNGEDFITDFEYGQMLYQDPHGASCAACHGETGGGDTIAEFTNRQGEIVALNAPDIRHVSLEKIRSSIHDGKGVMPRYFLTDKEIRTIHAYLKQVNKPKAFGVSSLFASQETNETTKSAE